MLELHGAAESSARFRASAPFQAVEAASPDNARSLLSFFTRPRPETTTALVAASSTAREMGVDLDLRPARLGWGAVLHGAGLTVAEGAAPGDEGRTEAGGQERLFERPPSEYDAA